MDMDESYRLNGYGLAMLLWGIVLLLIGLGVGDAGHESAGGVIACLGLGLLGLDLLLITYLCIFD